jgi:hypothetical protein
MHAFSVVDEQQFNAKRHVEKILGRVAEGDVTVACWEPGQISPYHCHPHATEIYFCFEGGGVMRTPDGTVLFRVRYGGDMSTRFHDWRGNPDWTQSVEDAAYFRAHLPEIAKPA